MDNTVQQRPSEILRQVAASMSWYDEGHIVKLPASTTHHTAIRAVEAATGDIERSIQLSNLTSDARKKILREKAKSNLCSLTSKLPPTLPIRSNIKPKDIGPSDRASATGKERL